MKMFTPAISMNHQHLLSKQIKQKKINGLGLYSNIICRKKQVLLFVHELHNYFVRLDSIQV